MYAIPVLKITNVEFPYYSDHRPCRDVLHQSLHPPPLPPSPRPPRHEMDAHLVVNLALLLVQHPLCHRPRHRRSHRMRRKNTQSCRRTMHQRIRPTHLRQRRQRLQRHHDPHHSHRRHLGSTHALTQEMENQRHLSDRGRGRRVQRRTPRIRDRG